jgi:SAM-dependent methyltransferase
MKSSETKNFWELCWTEKNTFWDLKGRHPLLPSLLQLSDKHGNLKPMSRIYVPGCGHAHDAAWLAKAGFEVVAADFVPEAIEVAKTLYGNVRNLSLEVGDVFSVKDHEQNSFDAVFDRAMFCALNPIKRIDYLKACQSRLKPNGLFTALLFAETLISQEEGPPFSVTLDEFKELSQRLFEVSFCEERNDYQIFSLIRSELLLVARSQT